MSAVLYGLNKVRDNEEPFNVDRLSLIIAFCLIVLACVVVIIIFLNMKPKTPLIKYIPQEDNKVQYTKIIKQYRITKNDNNEVNIDEETGIESNIKDGKFGELVNAIVEKSSIKNLQ